LHNKKFHPEMIKAKSTFKCSICSQSFCRRISFLNHQAEEHSHMPTIMNHVFDSEEEFVEWKKKTENSQSFKFVRNSGLVEKADSSVEYLECFRSGCFDSRSKGIFKIPCFINLYSCGNLVKDFEHRKFSLQIKSTLVAQLLPRLLGTAQGKFV